MTATSEPDILATARAAMERHDWRVAFEALTTADASTKLPPEGLELLADAAWWTGQLPLAIDAHVQGPGAVGKTRCKSENPVAVEGGILRPYLYIRRDIKTFHPV